MEKSIVLVVVVGVADKDVYDDGSACVVWLCWSRFER